ncbi:MAG TPA: hypothetical protein VFK41_01455 [Nocardioidaceae bacterium]|nr:hypothetical protein [Nocardioidaceae bacterium]
MTGDDEDFVRHLQSLGVPGAPPARRTGFDRNTEEGALLHFSGSLQRTNLRHRVVAWVLLVAFGLPVLMSLVWFLSHLLPWLWDQAS